jgi:hypothetical protein
LFGKTNQNHFDSKFGDWILYGANRFGACRRRRCSRKRRNHQHGLFYSITIHSKLFVFNADLDLHFSMPQIGTYPLALCAKATNKPFYVIAESFKFLRLFPISQQDIPNRLKRAYKSESGDNWQKVHLDSRVDYTPPSYITLLLTDLGPLTTAAVSDVLINLYL